MSAGSSTPKSKTTAVVLAVFLFGWSWLYTYKVNAKKFWAFFVLGAIILVLYIVGLSVFFKNTTCISGTNTCFTTPNSSGTYFAFAGLMSFGLWVWAIVDNATKSLDWYQNYPGR